MPIFPLQCCFLKKFPFMTEIPIWFSQYSTASVSRSIEFYGAWLGASQAGVFVGLLTRMSKTNDVSSLCDQWPLHCLLDTSFQKAKYSLSLTVLEEAYRF